ncbi:hypothetical protein [Paractinoplanes durhamensis]|uniref:DUF5666 domain-containing protein n=1 Tax=Paractinoplanes durhamensis TaxID=113563 RepID=A0ABQ3ZBM0_9ACTN|nr:hypothetical protein [Actinoplanes durhamensis]GIE07218.1 hypothetical protein Adu01nite_85680 [Actinoplanes durhamensis]
MSVYDDSTRSSGAASTWPPAGSYHSEPEGYYAAAPPYVYREEAPVREQQRYDLPPIDPYEKAPSRPPAEWTPAHADGPPPAWTPPEKAVATADAPAAGKNHNKLALIGGIVAVAVASAGVTAGIMAAVGGGSSATTGPGGGQGLGQNGPGTGQAGGTTTASALHGTYVVSDGNGGYVTQLAQTGTVSTISSSSITVKSDDGYSKTYVISTSTTVGTGRIADVLKGHTVRIVATSAKQKVTATSITDTSLAATGQQNGTPPQNGN